MVFEDDDSCHNTDPGDGWKHEGDNACFSKSPRARKAYPMGINVVLICVESLTRLTRLICSGAPVKGGSQQGSSGGLERNLGYEATISAIENPPQTAARFFKPQLKEERPSDSAESASNGTQAVDARLNPGLNGQAAGTWARTPD